MIVRDRFGDATVAPPAPAVPAWGMLLGYAALAYFIGSFLGLWGDAPIGGKE
jgi:hypothetical protein